MFLRRNEQHDFARINCKPRVYDLVKEFLEFYENFRNTSVCYVGCLG